MKVQLSFFPFFIDHSEFLPCFNHLVIETHPVDQLKQTSIFDIEIDHKIGIFFLMNQIQYVLCTVLSTQSDV